MAETRADSHLLLPAGTNMSVQYNNNGAIGGDNAFFFNNGTDTVHVGAKVALCSISPITADIGGPIKIADGTQSNQLVLTSDAVGLASWQDCAQNFNRIAVSLAGDVITAGGFVIYSSL
jgi:hypothetical protein